MYGPMVLNFTQESRQPLVSFQYPYVVNALPSTDIKPQQGLDEAMTPKAITLTIRTMFGFGPRKIAPLLHNILETNTEGEYHAFTFSRVFRTRTCFGR
jgi:hypothetical protein